MPDTKHSLKTSTRHPQWGVKMISLPKNHDFTFHANVMNYEHNKPLQLRFGSGTLTPPTVRCNKVGWLQNAAVYFLFRCLLDVNHGPLNSHPAGSAQVLVRECHVLPTVATPYAMRNEIKQIESLHFWRTATKSMTMTDREHFWRLSMWTQEPTYWSTGDGVPLYIVHGVKRGCGGVE